MNTAFFKKMIIFSLVLAVFGGSSAFAAKIESQGPWRKLQRGFLNIVLSPFEVANELHNEKKEDTFVPSWFSGAGRGLAYMSGRALTGVYEIVTFPFPLPADYEPVVYPEFLWEHFPGDEPATVVESDGAVSGSGHYAFQTGGH